MTLAKRPLVRISILVVAAACYSESATAPGPALLQLGSGEAPKVTFTVIAKGIVPGVDPDIYTEPQVTVSPQVLVLPAGDRTVDFVIKPGRGIYLRSFSCRVRFSRDLDRPYDIGAMRGDSLRTARRTFASRFWWGTHMYTIICTSPNYPRGGSDQGTAQIGVSGEFTLAR